MNLRLLIIFLFAFHSQKGSVLIAQKRLFPKYDIQSVAIGADVSSMELNVIFQDSKGFIWLGTETGLSKYDGTNFTNFDFTEGKKIASIFDIEEDEKGRIWAVGSKGLFYFDGQEFVQSMFKEMLINEMLIDRDQNLIIAGMGFNPRLISNLQMDSLTNGNTIDSKILANSKQWTEKFKTNAVYDIAEDNQGNLWIGLENRLLRLNNDELVEIWEGEDPEMNISEIVSITPDSVYWGGETTSLYFRNSEGVAKIPSSYTISLNRTDTSLVILTAWNLIQIKDDGFEEITTLEEIRHLYNKDFMQDTEGNFWVAAEGSLFKISKQYFHAWSVKDSSVLESNHSITQLKSGTILIGSNKRRNLEWNDYKFRVHPNEIPAANFSVTEAVLEDKYERIWFGTSMSGLILESNIGMQSFGEESGLIDKTILFIVQDEYDRLWTGGENGISQILEVHRSVSFKNYKVKEELASVPRFITVICHSHDQCWAFSRGGIYNIKGNELIPIDIEGLDDLPTITQAIMGPRGQLLVSTLGAGILRFEIAGNGNFKYLGSWDKSTGLLSDNMLSLHLDKEARIWTFSQNGACVIDSMNIQCYDQRDGWLPLETTHVDLLETEDSVMWVVSNSAIITFPLYDIPENTVVPKVFINDVKLFEGKQDVSRFLQASESKSEYNLILPYNQNFLQFNYTSTSHTRSEKNTFVYQLEGLEEEWSLPTSLTTANYPGLKPGKYIFKVKAINNSGFEANSIAQYSFRISYPWYARWWAILGYVLLATCLAYVLYDLRVSKRRKENEAHSLRELNNFQSNFYTNVTHEFRTPLTVIIGMTDQIKEKARNMSGPIDNDLKMINRNAERLLALVNQILNLSKLKQTKPQLNYINANIIGYISQIVESLQPYAKANDLSLFFYSEAEELFMDFDEQAISTILINLASNAVKNTQAKGQVFIHAKIVRKGKDYFILKVKDDGKGIPESQIEHLFDRFASAHQNQDDSMGLGLAMTKQLIDLLNGKILVSSKVNQGSEFTVKLPITNRSGLKKVPKSPIVRDDIFKTKVIDLPPHDIERQTILIIEDNKDVARYIIRCLESKYNLFYAENGKVGIELVKDKMPDLVVSDIMMPIMDGFEVCANLKNDDRTKHIPIILLTAKADQKAKILGIAKGADAYLTKPFSKVEFLGRIAQLLGSKNKVTNPAITTDIASILRSKHKDPDMIFIKEVIGFIHENLADDIYGPPFLARNLGISESNLYKKLKSSTGKSTALFIRSIRLEKAKELLLSTDQPVSEVASQTGFKNVSWFSRAFKSEFGYPPSKIDRN